MCLGVMAIGLLGIIRASKWKIAVNGNQMEIQRLFRKSIVLQISEIERVEIGKKNQLLLYASGKKLITIDFLTENYEYLEETLKRNGEVLTGSAVFPRKPIQLPALTFQKCNLSGITAFTGAVPILKQLRSFSFIWFLVFLFHIFHPRTIRPVEFMCTRI